MTRDEFGLAAVGKTRSELDAAMGAPAGTRTDSEGEIWFYRIKVRVPVKSQDRKDEPILFPVLVFRGADTACVLSGFSTPARMDDLLRKMGKTIPEKSEGATAQKIEEHRAFAAGKSYQQLVEAWGSPQTQTVSSDGNGDAAWQKDGLNISVYFDAGRTASVSIFPLP